jgi:diguanylate cyclase (GGDEF)-like protein
MAVTNFGASLLILLNLFYFMKTKKSRNAYLIVLLVCSFEILLLIPFGSGSLLSLIWIIILPLIAYYTQGARLGSFFSLSIVVLFLLLAIMEENGLFSTYYPPSVYRDIGLLFLIISFITYIYEKSLEYRENKVTHQLYKNDLTGLPNRRKLLEDLSSNQKKRTTVLFLINIDQFREINDIRGCESGDMVLKKIADRLSGLQNRYKEMKIYKLHADEYAIHSSIGNIDTQEYIQTKVQEIQQLLRKRISLGETSVVISASIGITLASENYLAKSDYAMRLARKHHRTHYVYRESMNYSRDYKSNLNLLSRLEKIVEEEGVIPFYQPIIDNKTGQVSKYECLMRLEDGDEILAPRVFMKLSQRAKVYGILTRILISRAFRFFEGKEIDFSINICLEDILNEETTTHICNELKKYNVGSQLIIEILETEQIEIYPQVSRFIKCIRSFGCRIAIDDFGSGYSNFDYLMKLKFDYLKIDSSLIQHLDSDRNSLIMVEAIVDFSQKLDLKTIAEHVQSKEIYEIVKSLGIDYSQGFYTGKPDINLVKKEQTATPLN